MYVLILSRFLSLFSFPFLGKHYSLDQLLGDDSHDGVVLNSIDKLLICILYQNMAGYFLNIHRSRYKDSFLPQRDLKREIYNARSLVDRACRQDVYIRARISCRVIHGQSATDFDQERALFDRP